MQPMVSHLRDPTIVRSDLGIDKFFAVLFLARDHPFPVALCQLSVADYIGGEDCGTSKWGLFLRHAASHHTAR